MTNTDSNVAMLQETYKRYAKEGIGPVLDHLTDDVVWNSYGPCDLPWCGQHIGRDGVSSFYERLEGVLSIVKYDVHQVIAQGEWVVALATVTAQSKASGRTESFEKADVFRMRDGQISEFREYYDSARALELLREQPASESAAG